MNRAELLAALEWRMVGHRVGDVELRALECGKSRTRVEGLGGGGCLTVSH
jgi:hypothetical protein